MVPSFFTNNSPRLCANDSVQLEATGFTGTLSWSGPSGALTSTSATIWVSEQGSYSVGDGVNTGSVYIGFDSDNPEIYSDDYPITSSTNGGIGSTSNASSPSGGLFGILSPSEEYLAPFGAEYANNKQQYLYRASELTDLGLAQGSTLKEIGFYLNASWNSNCNTQVELRVYQTTSTSMTGFETSNSDYLGSWNCMDYQSGWNYFDINDINWDGTENLVFEFCYNTWGGNGPQNPSIALDNVGFNASVVIANPTNSQCSATGGFVVNDYRPSTSFKYSNAARKDTIVLCGSASTLRLTSSAANYTWSSANSTYSGTTNELNVSSDDLVYITGYTNQFCKYDDTVQIYSASESVPTITASSTDFCEGDTETLSVTLTSNQSARWSTGESSAQISIVDGGAYTVTVSNEFGCSKTSAVKTITEIEKPLIYIDEIGSSIYRNESHQVNGNSSNASSFGPVHHLFDYDGSKYFVPENWVDSSTFVNVLANNDAASIGVIDNAAIDAVFQPAHLEKYNEDNSKYPFGISVGAIWNNTAQKPVWYDGSSSTYHNFDQGNTLGNNQDKDHFVHYYYANDYWWHEDNWNGAPLLKYDMSSLVLAHTGGIYCDSVQLFAPSIFDTYSWSTGDTTESIWVSGNGSHTISVTGTYTKSDGTTCSLTSDNHTFTINDAPALSITNLSGTSDLTGSNHIEIEADYTSGATIQWSTGSTNDSIHIYSTGEYTATATLNGCSVSKSFTAYQPMYVDATNGDDANGTGTLSDPYKTINKGISESQSRGKVYVLPGTYNETLNITKNVFIASDYFRLGNTNAVNTTIINGQGLRRLVNYDNTTEPLDSAASKIVGFTMKGGFQDSDDGAGIYGGWNVTGNTQIKNSVIEQTSRKCCANGIVLSWFSSGEIILDSVYVDDIGNSGDGDQRISFAVPYGKLTILNSRISNVLQDNSLFNISNSAELYIENTHITGISDRYNNNGVVLYLNNSAKAYFNHVTIDDIDLSDDRYVFRIGSGSYSTLHFVNSVVDETFGRFIMDQSSSNATIEIVNSVVGNAESGYSGSYSSNTPALTNTGELNNYSGAIGLARSTVNVSGKIYKSPPMDLLGGARPNPIGSNPDAGAYENAKSQGDFAAQTTSCGYLISAQVFNSDNYSVEWIQNGTVLGTDDDYLASSKGTYTLKVYSVDRSDTITKTVALNNPLNMEILDVSNSCEFISSNNGRVSWGNISGGTPYSSDWWTYRTAVRNESGSQIDGYWHLNNPQDYVGTKSNLAPGKYYFFIDDATGCEVGDTVEILEQVQSTYYVSTTGDNSNDGLSETDPFATISRAVSSTCKGDTVIVLDGTYFEDSITINGSVVIGSKYLIDGDTNHIHNTIIDGGSSAYVFDYPYSQTSSNWADTSYNRIEALTIQNGMVVNNDRGGALTLANERTLLIDRVQFKSNSAQRGGAVLQREWSRMALKNSTFTYNEASNDGGGFYCSDGYLVLTNNHFQNNSTLYHGGAMYLHSPRSLVMNNIDMVSNQANDGASGFFASLCCVGSSIDITNIRVLNGSGQMPILIHQSQSYWITFKNLLIAGNSSTQAEAMQIQDGSSKIRLVNSTVVNNNLTNGSTGFLKCDWGDVDLVIWNSILDANDATAILYDNTCNNYNLTIANSYVNLPSSSLYDNNCGTTNITYSSNITTGSYYEDIANGNYSPSSVSSVLGAGSSTATVAGASLSAPATDLLGNTRPSPTGTSPDLGAIESIESAPQIGLGTVVQHNGFCETGSGEITANLLNYSGTASYEWKSLTDANWSWNSTQTASNLNNGTYRVIASDNSTNVKLDSVDVTITTLPSISISNQSVAVNCNGDNQGELAFEIQGGNPFGTSQYQYQIEFLESSSTQDGYLWGGQAYFFTSDNNTSLRTALFSSRNFADDFRNGYYEISVTDEDGCSFADTVTLGYDHDLPSVEITTLGSDGVAGLTSMCSGSGNTISLTATVTGGGGTNSYTWSNASTAQTIGVAQSGEYTLEVEDQFGCKGQTSQSISFQSAPQVYVGAPAAKSGENITDFTYLGEYNDHHYYYYNLTHNYTWDQAKVVAENMGAYLWSVNSQAEHEAVAQMYQNQNQVCCEAFIGAYKEGGVWKWHSGEPFVYTNWEQNEPSNPNGDTRIRVQWGWWNNQGVPGKWEDYGQGGDQQKFILEFPSNQEFLSYSESFCDSVELFAGAIDGLDFADLYWVDSNDDTIGSGPSIMVNADQDLSVYGAFLRSDGQLCDLKSTEYTIAVNNSPNLTLSALSGTYDFTSGDTLLFTAASDSSGATIFWSVPNAGDTLSVTSIGSYTATASMNGCSVSESFVVEEAMYVAKTGNDISGDGSLSNPYKTIQHGIDMAPSGGKLYVLPGTYNENLVFDKQIRLLSDFVRLDNSNARSTTIINAGFSGRAIEFSNTTRIDVDSTVIDGFTIKNGDANGDEGSGIYANWNQGSGLTINNSIISNHRKQCCSDGIAMNIQGVDLYLNNVDILDNGSPVYWDERQVLSLRHLTSVWNEVRFNGNESNNSLIYLYETDLTINNSEFIGNTIQDNNQALIGADWNSDVVLNHVTMTNNIGQGYGIKVENNQDQKVVVYNSAIDGFAQGGIKTAGSNNEVYLINSIINSIPQAISGNGNVTSVNALEIASLELNTNGTLKQTSPAIGLGGADTTVAGYRLSSPAFDLVGAMRPNPAGSRPDAGAYEDSLARGMFGLEVSNCGYSINAKVLNSDAYSITISSSNGFYSTNSDVEVSLKGTYTIAAFDSVSSQIISKTVAITNPLSVDYIFGRDACASNGGFGEIIVGEFTGGTQYNIPNNSWFDYYLSINDSSGSNIYNQEVSDDNGSRWNTSVQAGVYTIGLSDASGCTVYDTVEIDDLIGSKYYISTTGSDTALGSYTEPLSTITEAISRACDGDTIVLFDGEYFENVEIKNSTMPYVIIASEFIEDGDDDHIAATKVNGMDEDPVFDVRDLSNSSEYIQFVGFTITNGKSNSNWYGGGGISAQNSHISLDHMVVSGNRSGNSGGGIGLDNGELKLNNSIIENNLASNDGGGIYITAVGEVNATGDVIIRNNKSNSSGGGISWNGHWGTELSLSGMTIENNESQYDGGGLYAGNGWGNNGASVTLENLIIKNNRSINGTGGAFINGSGNDVTLQNAIIAYNKSNSTGGLLIENADIDVIHTTIYNNGVLNGTTSNDQILLRNNANVVFLNSAVGGQEVVGTSTAHTFYIDDFDVTCDLTIESSIISGGTTSIDNPYSSTITGTPIGQALYLSDPANGDYMLSPVSQGLGAGTTSYSGTTIPLIDIVGNSRPGTIGQNPDVGAVESPLDSATFGAAYEIRNNIACDNTYGRLKVIPLNGSGAYKFELDDLTGTATFTDQQNVSSYTYSSLYSGDYFVTITDIGTTPNSVFTDTVSIRGKDSLQLIKDVTNEFCFGESNGSISLNVIGGDGFYDYTWSTATNSAYPKTSVLNNLSPEEYFVTVKDGDNCFVEDSVTIITLHSLPTVVITGEITKGSTTTTTTNPQIRACAGDEVTLNAGSGFVSYNWTTVDGLNNWTTQTLPASYEQGFYLTAVDAFGCSNSDSAEVFYVQTPAIYASNVNTNIGASMQSVTSYVEGTSQRIGNNYNDAKPYGAGDNYAKMQFIIPASELIAEGLTDQTTINSIGFEVEVESGSPVQSFKIKMKNTSSNQVSSTFESGLTQVYDLNILTPGEGWNTHVLDNGFNWDGTKNLLVQVEYSNVAFSNGSDNILMGADYSYSASAIATGMSNVASSSNANYTSTWRPNIKFGIDKVQATDTLRVCDFTMLNTTDDYDTYSWLVGSTSMGSALRYSVNSPVEVVLKTVDAASSCTMYSDTVQVLLDTTPSVFVTAPNLLGCVGDTLTSSVDTVTAGIEYSWSNGYSDTVAEFYSTGQYYVFATSPSGCQGVDTVDVNINIPPDVVVELNGKVLTSTDGSLVADNSACDTTLILPYLSTVDTLSALNNSEWSTYSSEYLDWEYQAGWDSLVDFTGPRFDANNDTTGGFYQFDPASLTDQNKVGYLQLGCINLLGMSSPELNFAYHMVDVYADSSNTSDQMGTMSLEVKTPSDISWTTLWQRSGTDTSYKWVDKSVDLSAYVNKTIQLRWKGQAGVGGPRSEMGLDNISLNDSLALLSNVAGRITPETVCEGDSISANAISNGTTNFSFLWNTGDTTSAVELHNTGWYSVSVLDEKNCLVTSDSVYIEVNPAPMQQLVLSDTTQYCESLFDSLTITANSFYTAYQWYANYNNEGFTEVDTTNEIMLDSIALGSQEFYVMITDSLGCRSTSDVVELIETPSPSLVLSSNDVLCNSDSTGQAGVVANGSGAWGYLWSNGDTASESLGLPTGYYAVTVTDTFSCVATDSVFVGEPTAVSLSVVSSIDVDCFGSNSGSADIDFTGGVGGYNFTWTDSSGTWSSSNEDLTAVPASEYYVIAQDSNGCSLADTVMILQPTELLFTVDSVVDLSCKGSFDGYLEVSALGGSLPYQFIANLDTNATGEFYNLDSNYYALTVLDANGCTVNDFAVVSQPDPPFNEEEICIVTVDTTGVNMVVWEKTPGKRTSEYVILKENASTQYTSIGTTMYNDMSTYVDQNSNPAVQPFRYKIALKDSCGFYSDTSDYHATIHLQASPGVASNEVQLQWTAYEGKQVQTYYIYRWLSPSMRVLVDSVSSNVQTYTDIYPVTTTITALLYEVGAKFVDAGCSPTAGKNSSYLNSLSNRLDWGQDGGLPIGTEEWVNVVLENDLEIYPNPSRGKLNVSMTGAWMMEKNVKLKVMDMTGRTLAVRTVEHGGTVSFDFTDLPAGVYFLHTITENGRMVVKRFERVN